MKEKIFFNIMDQLLLELQNDQPSVDKITEGLIVCIELLQSVGKASETEVSALADNLYVLSLSRRDSILHTQVYLGLTFTQGRNDTCPFDVGTT